VAIRFDKYIVVLRSSKLCFGDNRGSTGGNVSWEPAASCFPGLLFQTLSAGCSLCYSDPNTSFPFLVPIAEKVIMLIESVMNRTLPSAIVNWAPPG